MADFCRHCGEVVPAWANACPSCGLTTADSWQHAGAHPATPAMAGYIVHLEPPSYSRRANFTIVRENGPEAVLECPRCGWQFPVNVYTGENIAFDSQTRTLRETCPLCGTMQE